MHKNIKAVWYIIIIPVIIIKKWNRRFHIIIHDYFRQQIFCAFLILEVTRNAEETRPIKFNIKRVYARV